MGGTLHWKGSESDNNESGIAGWNRQVGVNSSDVGYMVEDPGKDFAANEDVAISITDICVQLVGIQQTGNGAVDPEIVTTTFTTDFYTEDTHNGTLSFNVMGIKAQYNGYYYVMGNAFYSGNPGKSRFNDVADIYLKNCSTNILYGGTLHWRGTYTDNNECGVAGFNKNGGTDTNSIRYMMEDPGKDFAGNEDNIISITGICIRLGAVDDNVNVTPSIATTSFTASLYCENKLEGSATFSVVGLRVKYGEENYIFGNAFYSGTPGGSRFNDVARFYLKNITKSVYCGGTLHWYGSNSDNNESAVAGYDTGMGSGTEITYLQEDPGKDFAANEGNEISITGICVQE